MVTHINFAEWVRENPPPDLQALVSEYGGYDQIPEEAWQAFERSRKNWNLRLGTREWDR